MKEQILFETVSGSKLYGTNSETSDTDIKGVFLPNINDLILNKAPKHYTSSTGSISDRNSNEDIDKTYYSLQYFLELAAKGETNAIDLLFAYTNKNAVLQISDIWVELTKNIDKIITKNINAYLGYCKSQAFKYSIKGEKLNNFKEFELFCEKYLNDGDVLTLYDAIHKEFYSGVQSVFFNEFNSWIGNPNQEKTHIMMNTNTFNFGEHCYIITASNKESFLQISDVKFPIKDNISSSYYKVKKVIGSYGKRAENAAADNGADYKAISHCVRVLLQVEELLKTGSIIFPLKDAEFIKSIKYKTTNLTFDGIIDFINKKIDYIENVLLPNSKLRDKADHKWIEKFILNCYNH